MFPVRRFQFLPDLVAVAKTSQLLPSVLADARFKRRSNSRAGITRISLDRCVLDITGDAFHPDWNSTVKPR